MDLFTRLCCNAAHPLAPSALCELAPGHNSEEHSRRLPDGTIWTWREHIPPRHPPTERVELASGHIVELQPDGGEGLCLCAATARPTDPDRERTRLTNLLAADRQCLAREGGHETFNAYRVERIHMLQRKLAYP